jgi:mono/diheme cytochrome c family protein
VRPALQLSYSIAFAVGALVSFGALHAAAIAQKAETAPAIWKGIFTPAQLERGKAVYRADCATCHDATELGEAPSLSGDIFMRNWEGHTVGRLYTKILEQMPANNVRSVSPSQKLDVLAYILHENGFPSGADDLTADAQTLARIQIVPQGGPRPPRTGATVQAVGCLTSAAAKNWDLTSSTEPVVTTLAPPAAEELQTAQTKRLGTQTIRLLHVFPSPEPHKGHRVEVKGFLVREGTNLAINVVSLTALAPECP